MGKVNKVLLTQPNYSSLGKRSWKLFPYGLGIINASVKNYFQTELFDPNFFELNDKEIANYLRHSNPDVVGIGSISTEYASEIENMASLTRKTLPNATIIEGGVFPTVAIGRAMKDKSVDYWMIGEAESSFLELLKRLDCSKLDLSGLEGLAYYKNGKGRIIPAKGFNEDLDSISFADYGNLNFSDYANQSLTFAQGLRARRYPYATTITSRGCPYRCIFCSGPRISGQKVRMRSAENVLEEIDEFYKKGVKEVVFLDDHFLFSKSRAVDIMKGLIDRKYDLDWKCANLTAFLLDEEILDYMKESRCYQITSSIESGNQYVLKNIIKKPINLEKIPGILDMVKQKGFESLVNFVIGFPHETWDQIRDTFDFAENLNADLINFHIATPLPNTELMETCIKEGYIPSDSEENFGNVGYTHGLISTDEFSSQELQILRAFEWDRINFKTEDRKKAIARIQGISLDELEKWRKETRRKLGVSVVK